MDTLYALRGIEKYTAQKLVATVEDKDNYVVHYRTLSVYLSLGLKIKTINRILKFKQEAFLKPYVDRCTELRRQSKSDFKKNLFKLLINSMFGKLLTDPRKFLKCKLALDRDTFIQHVSKPNHKCTKIISNDLVAVFANYPTLQMNQPIIIGFSVLEIAKSIMYNAYYFQLIPKLKAIDPSCFIILVYTGRYVTKKAKKKLP